MFKNASEIRAAVDAGKKVYWSTKNYEVIKDKIGQYLVVFDRGGRWENYTGLTWCDNETLNYDIDKFFTD